MENFNYAFISNKNNIENMTDKMIMIVIKKNKSY